MRIAYRTISATFIVLLLIASSRDAATAAGAESCNEARPASPAAAVKAFQDGVGTVLGFIADLKSKRGHGWWQTMKAACLRENGAPHS